MIPLLGLLVVALIVVLVLLRRRARRRPSAVVQELDSRSAGGDGAESEDGGTCVYTADTDPMTCLIRSGKRD